MKTRNYLTAVCVAIAALGTAGVAQAATANGDFNVTIKITPTCSVNTNSKLGGARITTDAADIVAGADIDFGEYTSTHTAAIEKGNVGAATAAIAVTCTKKAGYKIGLTPQNVASTTGAGQMYLLGSSGTTADDKIPYQLYKPTVSGTTVNNTASTNVWGNVNGTNTLDLSGTGTAQNIPVFGKVPANSLDKNVGRYEDQVKVTVTY